MTRVLLVVATRLYRDGLANLLNAHETLTVVGCESTGHDALARLEETAPDVALIDIGLPDLGAMATTLAQRSPRIPLVAIGINDGDSDVVAYAELGIASYVRQESSVEELTAAVQAAADGELICSARTAGALIRRLAEIAAERHREDGTAPLTRREREIATLMCEDLSNKEIATQLRIEVATVKNHIHNVLDKLRVHRRSEAIRLLARSTNRLPDHV